MWEAFGNTVRRIIHTIMSGFQRLTPVQAVMAGVALLGLFASIVLITAEVKKPPITTVQKDTPPPTKPLTDMPKPENESKGQRIKELKADHDGKIEAHQHNKNKTDSQEISGVSADNGGTVNAEQTAGEKTR